MREPKRVILELLLIAAIGTALGLTANAMNPKGLELARNYYPPLSTVTSPSNARPLATQPHSSGTGSAPAQADPGFAGLAPEIIDKLRGADLTPIRQAEVQELFESPLYPSGLYMFIDARDDAEYAGGHIPGAHQLFYYDQRIDERYENELRPLEPNAEKVIVYCNGGECEDSVNTADRLRSKYGVDPAKVFVYPEGFEAWRKAGLPVERGERNSGDIVQGSQPAAGGK